MSTHENDAPTREGAQRYLNIVNGRLPGRDVILSLTYWDDDTAQLIDEDSREYSPRLDPYRMRDWLSAFGEAVSLTTKAEKDSITQLVWTWISNDCNLYECWYERSKDTTTHDLSVWMREHFRYLGNPVRGDASIQNDLFLYAVDSVDWYAIAQALRNEE